MRTQTSDFDVVVIGAGPAGFTAAAYLGRFLIKTLLLETPAMASSSPITKDQVRSSTPGKYYNLPGFPEGIDRATFKNKGLKQAIASGCEYLEEKVLRIIPQSGCDQFVVETPNGSIKTDKIILAMGIQDCWPIIDNIEMFAGQSIFASVQANGMEAKDKTAGVIGSNDKAFEEAMRLCVYATKVYLLSNGEVCKLSAQMRQLNMAFPIEIIEDPIASLEGENGELNRIVFENGNSIDAHVLFSPFPKRHASDLLTHNLNLHKDDDSFIIVNALYETSMKNIYAVGDMVNSPHKQVISSMYEGMEAAWAINDLAFKTRQNQASLAMEY